MSKKEETIFQEQERARMNFCLFVCFEKNDPGGDLLELFVKHIWSQVI